MKEAKEEAGSRILEHRGRGNNRIDDGCVAF